MLPSSGKFERTGIGSDVKSQRGGRYRIQLFKS